MLNSRMERRQQQVYLRCLQAGVVGAQGQVGRVRVGVVVGEEPVSLIIY